MTDREAFEAWTKKRKFELDADPLDPWTVWQAALASERAKQAEPVERVLLAREKNGDPFGGYWQVVQPPHNTIEHSNADTEARFFYAAPPAVQVEPIVGPFNSAEELIAALPPAVQGEPVAWADPLDLADCHDSFIVASNNLRSRRDYELRFTSPLYAALSDLAEASESRKAASPADAAKRERARELVERMELGTRKFYLYDSERAELATLLKEAYGL